MRVPVLIAGVLALLQAFGSQRSEGAAASAAPLLILERTDGGTRAKGLVAYRVAVYADGTVLSAGARTGFGRGRIEATRVSALAELVERARLDDLPAVVESRAEWFDLGDASTTLRWSGSAPAVVRIAGDMRAHAADRELAPHGFVEVLEFLESIPLDEDAASPGAGAVVEFTLEPWTAGDASPFRALIELEPRPWPADLAAPRAGVVRAKAEAAREVSTWVREGRPVTWDGKTWRVRARTLFPFESARSDSAHADEASQPI